MQWLGEIEIAWVASSRLWSSIVGLSSLSINLCAGILAQIGSILCFSLFSGSFSIAVDSSNGGLARYLVELSFKVSFHLFLEPCVWGLIARSRRWAAKTFGLLCSV